MTDDSRELGPKPGEQAAASLLRNDSYWLAEFARAAHGDNTAGLLAFALFRSWQVGRETEFVQRTGRPASEFDAAEFLALVRPEIMDRILSDARAMINGVRNKRVQSYEPDRTSGATRHSETAGMFTAFAACFLALLAFSAVRSIANIPGLASESSGEIDFPFGVLSFAGVLFSGFALGYAVRARRSQRRRRPYY